MIAETRPISRSSPMKPNQARRPGFDKKFLRSKVMAVILQSLLGRKIIDAGFSPQLLAQTYSWVVGD
jgi:hypothetical protein